MSSRWLRAASVAGAVLSLACVIPRPGTGAPGVRPIAAPARPLTSERASAGVSRFAFVAYGDTRSGGQPPMDGEVVHPEHSRVVDRILERAAAARSTPFPIRFVIQSGDAVIRGSEPAMWNVSFSPIIDRLTRAGLPYFFAIGNHDVHPDWESGYRNTLAALSRLVPREDSPRRLRGYLAYTLGFGNLFVMALDSNIPEDDTQLAWAANQLERVDRSRYRHIAVVLHHPAITSGPHGGPIIERESQGLRDRYMPLFRRHGVRLIIAGHDHLYDHWVERYVSDGEERRLDQIVAGGGGAPIYTYRGEPDLAAYLAAGAAENLRVEHLARPGPDPADNPHHFIVITVDGDRLALEVVSTGDRPLAPFGGRSQIDLNR